MKTKTILIVDDTVENLDILGSLLEKYDIIDAISGKDALEILEEETIDLILLDIMMPEMNGYEVCAKIQENPNTKNIPIIFITAKTDEDSIEKAYDIGGIDYVSKPFKPKELLAKVNRELTLQELQKELRIMATTDSLSGLYNRRYFTQSSEQIFHLSKREKQELSIIMIDIDKFKSINDNFGHKIGDDVIVYFANELKKIQRKSDLSCRYGGEEFVLLLPNTSLENATIVAEKLRSKIELSSLKISSDQEIQFTVSLGVATVDFINDATTEPSLKKADEAMYRAKNSGRNKVCVSK